MRDRTHPRLADLQRYEVAVAAIGAADEVAGRPVDRLPVEGHLASTGASGERLRSGQPWTRPSSDPTRRCAVSSSHRAPAAAGLIRAHFRPVVAIPG